MDYANTKIYKIESHSGDKIYIGSTTKEYLSQRMTNHRSDYKRWKAGLCGKVMVYDMFDEYDISNCNIILLETFPCKSNDEKLAREAHYIKTLTCINKCIPNRTNEERYQDNKVKVIQRVKVWSDANVEKVVEYKKKHYDLNKERILSEQAEVCMCECGQNYTAGHRKRHLLTKKHKLLLESKTDI